ncbi:Crp/Fnr family transcriptional regulator [Suttonella indologenes]|uniref:cAMP regulatory protein n=1 Tax=Suttonella indologenes TaxID=13276 RepID=A0A380MJ47_9GAMM|nr:Crp/Fnr family transcriptional regulator [Suttonella indologenes]SUO92362.1 cAMP regulatory protein [Suttonella indologenes]
MRELEILAQIENHHLFAPLNAEQRKSLLANSRVQQYQEDALIFNKNEATSAFFFILEGAVRLYFSAPDGKEKTVRIFEKGSSFAEALMFMARDSYPANAMAVMPSKLLVVNSHFYRKMISQHADLAVALLAKCCEHIHLLSQQIEMLSVLDARSRFVQYIRQQLPVNAGDGYRLYIPMPKKDLAQYLAIRPETLSRLIRQLENEEILQWQQQNYVVVQSLARLQE